MPRALFRDERQRGAATVGPSGPRTAFLRPQAFSSSVRPLLVNGSCRDHNVCQNKLLFFLQTTLKHLVTPAHKTGVFLSHPRVIQKLAQCHRSGVSDC